MLFGLSALFAVSHIAQATPYNEVGDAGYSLATAQVLPENTTSIIGELDAVDIYRFSWTGGIFEATTVTAFDPMLFVFDLAGTRLAFNDDWFSLQSFISVSLSAGDYLLAIDRWPYNYGGDLNGFAAAGSSTGGNPYTINLNAGTGASVPEPAPLALLAAGLLAFAVQRRKRA